MKNTIQKISIALALTIVIGLVGCSHAGPAATKEDLTASGESAAVSTQETVANGDNQEVTQGEYISVDDAKTIAANHAGFSADTLEFQVAKLDTDDFLVHYDVKFVSGDYEYDYEIDAKSGQILDFDKEYEPTSAQSTSTYISGEEAKAIALGHAGLTEGEIQNYKSEMDTDDLIAHFEIEFTSGVYEYEYDVNAKTGNIIGFEKEID